MSTAVDEVISCISVNAVNELGVRFTASSPPHDQRRRLAVSHQFSHRPHWCIDMVEEPFVGGAGTEVSGQTSEVRG